MRLWIPLTIGILLCSLFLIVHPTSGANTLTITFAGSLYDTNTGTHTVTATPALNDLIVILTANTGNAVATAPTDNAQGGTYQLVATSVKAASADRMALWVRQSLIMDGVSTIFTSAAGTTTGGGLTVWRVSGAVQPGSAAVLQSAFQSNVASGIPAPVLTRVPIGQDAIIAAMTNAASPAGMTPRAGYTEDVDVGYATPTTGIETMYRASGETSATITWGSSSASAFSSVAIEIYAYQVAYPSLIASAAEGAGVNCANAGQKFTYGLDNGDGGGTALDGILQAGEVDTTVYVCNGANGAAGTNGFNSLVSTSVAAESPGANCANGGTKVTFNSGLDDGLPSGTARDNILQAGEIEATTTFYSCTGSTGATGAVGFNSLVSTVTAVEAPGANCATGGTKVTFTSGLDNGDGGGTARDGILQAGEIDQTTIFFSCRGAVGATGPSGADGYNSLILTVAELPGLNCLVGGIKITTGLDNGDGGGTPRDSVLQAGEVDAGPYYVCNGSAGLTGPTGPQGPPGPQGSPGVNSLVATSPESPGVNCAAGGIRLTSGLDNGDGGGTANDGILQSGEVDSTSYVCNGVAGATGVPGHAALVSTSSESPGVNCANGGLRIDFGTDTNDDSVLQPGEITSSSYACNGAPGTAGATGATGATGPIGLTGPQGTGGASPVWMILVIPLAAVGCLIVASAIIPRRK